MDKSSITRRAFLAAATTTAVLGACTRINRARVVPRKISPNETLHVAGVGVGGKGLTDIMNCSHEHVVALCDIDRNRAAEAFHRLPEAQRFQDWRVMLDKLDKEIDALTITTPDHMHALIAYHAMMAGKHVYVQKPLTHTVAEARMLKRLARQTGVATQMGNQGNSMDAPREVCEMIWSGAIGSVKEAHVFTDRPGRFWKQGIARVLPAQPVPKGVEWDLFIGTAPMRDYNAGYHPFVWRGWWDFGCCAIGDMACHNMNPAWRALKLHEARRVEVRCIEQKNNNSQTGPTSSIIEYRFGDREGMGPCSLFWYDGAAKVPHPEDVPKDEPLGHEGNGTLFVGTEGYLTCNVHGENARLLPAARMADYQKPEPWMPRVAQENHYQNWIDACKGGPPAVSSFDYSGPLTELAHIGNIALRSGRALEYDFEKGRFRKGGDANRYLEKEYRRGWRVPT